MKVLAVIPARYDSSRLPGKPLAVINGKKMIEHVYISVVESGLFDSVVVATDDMRILNFVKSIGGNSMMTDKSHQSGTDRVAEVAEKYKEYDIIVNVQGDQPFVTKEILNSLIKPFHEASNVKMSTVATKMMGDDYRNPNAVKVLLDKNKDAIYFSRSPIPYYRNKDDAPVFLHIGVYAYTRRFLLKMSNMTQTRLEICEGLEQLRVIENGYKIRVSEIEQHIIEVNTPSDLDKANRLAKL